MHIIKNLPASDYHAHPAVSKSVLDKIARSPLHARAYLDGARDEPTPAMQFGTALHTCVIEPELFAEQFVVFSGDRRTKEGKSRYEELQASGSTIISAGDFDAITAMATAVRHHQIAAPLFLKGRAEHSVFWQDEITELECKCRPDWWIEDGTLVDVKTTEDASPAGFAKSVAAYRYHVQAAHYIEGTQAERFLFVAIEKKAPYAVAVYELDGDALALGRLLRMRDLERYASCAEFNIWPGYAPEIQTLTLPKWASNQEIEA